MTKPHVRCAIYTRKSSEEGLDQDFNSLDAQREACEAYIRSQKHEGWSALETRYDDGGLSGATIDRPALQSLLDDVRARRIDVVVVYKVDRLTRSLADFAKIVEAFDANGVSFVSVTQQFNTTTSMGRLTLNVLLSFAQFEREVTAERIRDKIAASKKKGMWMGGTVPLGYDAKDRSLVVNDPEAEVVKTLFRLYVEHGSVDKVVEEARAISLKTKAGQPLFAGALYHLLESPIYIGRIRHKDAVYQGLHPAIIDQDLWDGVQARLAENRVARANGTRARQPSLLAGLLWDEAGRRFTPSHAVKDGKRYRYYVQRLRPEERVPGSRPRLKRLPAAEIEAIVTNAIVRLLDSPSALVDAVGDTESSAHHTKDATDAGARLAERMRGDAVERHARVRSLVDRVTLAADAIRTDVSRTALRQALESAPSDAGTSGTTPEAAARKGIGVDAFTVEIAAKVRVRGNELRFVIDGPSGERPPERDPGLIRVVVQGHDWFQRLLTSQARSLQELAKTEGVTDRYVRRLIDLAFLAPDIATAILDGRQPVDLTAEKITCRVDLPLSWPDQRRVLGFE